MKKVISNGYYEIVLDNSMAKSFNVNIDSPSYHVFASSKKDAIEKLRTSDFAYKNKDISKINILINPLTVTV